MQRPKRKKQERGPGRPKNPIKCPRCSRTGGTLYMKSHTVHGKTYYYPCIQHHIYNEKHQPIREDCHLTKKMLKELPSLDLTRET